MRDSDNEREFVPFTEGRCYRETAQASLGLTGDGGQLRFDGLARLLQNVATNDWRDAVPHSRDTWVVRRTEMRLTHHGRLPRYLDSFELATWCAGHGAAWIERRTDVILYDQILVECSALWVPIDATGHPVRLGHDVFDAYPGARERKVPGRVGRPDPLEGRPGRPWILREADFDVVGHVNNAALWQAVTECLASPVTRVSVVHHGPVERGDDVELRHDDSRLALLVDGDVRVSANWS